MEGKKKRNNFSQTESELTPLKSGFRAGDGLVLMRYLGGAFERITESFGVFLRGNKAVCREYKQGILDLGTSCRASGKAQLPLGSGLKISDRHRIRAVRERN